MFDPIRAALERLVELDNSSPMQDDQWAWKHENAIADAIEALSAAPPAAAAGEVGELLQFLRDFGDELMNEHGGVAEHNLLTRAADLLEQLQDLAADAVSGLRYIEQTHGRLYGVGWGRVYEKADRLQAVHARAAACGGGAAMTALNRLSPPTTPCL